MIEKIRNAVNCDINEAPGWTQAFAISSWISAALSFLGLIAGVIVACMGNVPVGVTCFLSTLGGCCLILMVMAVFVE